MHTIREKSTLPRVLIYTGWQSLLLDDPFMTLLMQRLD